MHELMNSVRLLLVNTFVSSRYPLEAGHHLASLHLLRHLRLPA